MSSVFSLISFLSLSLWSFAIYKVLSKQLRKYAFILGIALITLVLYQFTFKLGFKIGQEAIYLIALGILFFDFYNSKGFKFLEFVKENKLFFIFSFIWFVISATASLADWDEFVWASFVKHINHYGTYWQSDAAIISTVMRYLPGTALWENFFLGNDLYLEGPLYFSMGLIFIAGSSVFYDQKLGFRKVILSLALFACALSWFCVGLGSICVDGAMGILLAASLMAIDDVKTPLELTVPILIAMLLAMVKETGFLLSFVCLFCIFLRILRQREFNKKWILLPLSGLVLIGLNYLLWQWHLQSDPNMYVMPSGQILNQISADAQHLSTRTAEILKIFFHGLNSRAFPSHIGTGTIFDGHFDSIGTFVFWTFLLLVGFTFFRKKYEYLASFIVGLIGYTSVIMITYVYFFGDFEGYKLASYERYIGVYFLAFVLMTIKLLVEDNLIHKKAFLTFLLLLTVLYPPTLSHFFPPSLKSNSVTDLKKALEPIRNKIIAMTPEKSRVWFIWQNSNGIHAMIARYEVAPRLITENWSLGDKYYDGDVWTANYSLPDFIKKMNNFDYVAFGNSDENFLRRYGSLFSPAPRTGSLYKKDLVNGQLRLLEK